MIEQTTNATTDSIEDDSNNAPSLIARMRSHGSNLIMGGLIAVAGAGLYAMHLHTRNATAALAKINAANSIGPQTVIAFQHTIAETRKLVDSMQAPGDVINASHAEIGDPFTYVRQRPPQTTNVPTRIEPQRPDHNVLRSEALKLNLQSILRGKSSYCLINNQLFTEGQTIGKFVIERITSDAVHVRSGDFAFELRMNRR